MSVASTLISQSLSKSTKHSYKRSWVDFKSTCQSFAVPHCPASSRALLLYIGHCVTNNLSYRTILTRLSAISFVHKFRQVKDSTQTFLVKKCLLGCRKSLLSHDVRKPISREMLCTLCDNLTSIFADSYRVLLFKAMFMLAFYAFLRVSEFTLTSNHNTHVLKRSQISIVSPSASKPQMISIQFHSYKHSKDRPFVLNVESSANKNYCPVYSIVQYLNVRSDTPGPFFIFKDGAGVSSSYFNSVLKSLVLQSTGDCNGYSSHSFRIGAATYCFHEKKMSKEIISKMARWSSNAIDSYIRVQSFCN